MRQTFVLGVHPSARGFGWALFEGPLIPFDWGTFGAHKDMNFEALARFERVLKKYEPRVVALEAYEGDLSQRSERIRQLCKAMINMARACGATVHIVTRDEIAKTFGKTEKAARYEIAAAVAERIGVLRPRLPKPRKAWQGEHPNTALFAAAACALTCLLGKHS